MTITLQMIIVQGFILKDLFWRKVLLIFLPITLLYIVFCFIWGSPYPFTIDNNEYLISPLDALFSIAASLAWAAIWYHISKLPGLPVTSMNRYSRNITSIYCISWVIIMAFSTVMICLSPCYDALPTVNVAEQKELFPSWVGLLSGAVIVVITDVLSTQWEKFKSRRNRRTA